MFIPSIETQLTGLYYDSGESADEDAVLEEIKVVMEEERDRQSRLLESDD